MIKWFKSKQSVKQWWEHYRSSNVINNQAKDFFSKFKTHEEFEDHMYREYGISWDLYKINGKMITLAVFWDDYTSNKINYMYNHPQLDLFNTNP